MANNMKMTFKVKQDVLSRVRENITKGLVKMAYGISNQAKRNAPVDTGALKNSIRVATDGKNTVAVIAGGLVGGKSISYALKREHENKKHPDTKRYMGRAFEQETANYAKYFKGITK